MITTTSPYDVAEHLRTSEEKAASLEACNEEAEGELPSLPRLLVTSHGPRG